MQTIVRMTRFHSEVVTTTRPIMLSLIQGTRTTDIHLTEAEAKNIAQDLAKLVYTVPEAPYEHRIDETQ